MSEPKRCERCNRVMQSRYGMCQKCKDELEQIEIENEREDARLDIDARNNYIYEQTTQRQLEEEEKRTLIAEEESRKAMLEEERRTELLQKTQEDLLELEKAKVKAMENIEKEKFGNKINYAFSCIINNDVADLKECFRSGEVTPHSLNHKNQSMLYCALINNKHAIADYLLTFNVDLFKSINSSELKSQMWELLKRNDLTILQYLFDNNLLNQNIIYEILEYSIDNNNLSYAEAVCNGCKITNNKNVIDSYIINNIERISTIKSINAEKYEVYARIIGSVTILDQLTSKYLEDCKERERIYAEKLQKAAEERAIAEKIENERRQAAERANQEKIALKLQKDKEKQLIYEKNALEDARDRNRKILNNVLYKLMLKKEIYDKIVEINERANTRDRIKDITPALEHSKNPVIALVFSVLFGWCGASWFYINKKINAIPVVSLLVLFIFSANQHWNFFITAILFICLVIMWIRDCIIIYKKTQIANEEWFRKILSISDNENE